MARRAPLALPFAALLAGCGRGADRAAPARDDAGPAAPAPIAEPANTTPNQLLAAGPVTIVTGTAGDDRADRIVAAQAALIHGLLSGATIVDDTSFDAGGGAAAWPPRPMVYGGPHVNAAIAAIAPGLPLRLEPGTLALGGATFTGDDVRVIAVIPGSDAHPELLLYAGTGTPGVEEINAVSHGREPIVIADAFGRLTTGRWIVRDGAVTAALDPPARRIAWRAIERPGVSVRLPQPLDPAADDDAIADAAARAHAAAAARLGIASPAPATVYVHPDRRSKLALTGEQGAGHAVPVARAVHVIRAPAAELERLLTHELTHVIQPAAWGPAPSALWGEGLAVYAAGGYQGVSLADWRARLAGTTPPPIATLLGPAFRKRPEPEAYPLAGLIVEIAIAEVGLAAVRDHLAGATAATWDDACARAGTTAAALDAALARALAR